MIYRLPLGQWADTFIHYLLDNFRPVFRAISGNLDTIISGFESLLMVTPPIVFIVLIALISWKLAGRNVAIFTVLGLAFIFSLDLWPETMRTISMILSAGLIALTIGIPIGIIASRYDAVDKLIRPILDFMQTMPIFVYLLPAVMLFSIGIVPAVIATIVFSMPPAIRLTNLGIRYVPEEMIEAAESFGSTPLQMLVKVQLPVALPSIMAGVNQTIMLALSMVVIGAMIGAGGLGGVVYRAITRHQIGMGVEGGVAVVVVAIILDRITQSVGQETKVNEE